MKLLRSFTYLLAVGASSSTVWAGGLFLPGAGAVSTSRAGAGVASADDGEALAMNPAGLAKTTGHTLTISVAMFQYAMQFTRQGTYDDIPEESQPYEGQPFPTVVNDPKPPLGFGKMQPVPVVAFVTDLGGVADGKLRLAVGLYAPNAYPFRDMSQGYVFNSDYARPPPGSRYDIVHQEAAVLLPSIAASYRILPELDVGVRFSSGFAHLKSTVNIWATTNYDEWVRNDGQITLDAKDTFVPAAGIGATYRPTPNLEFGVNYNSEAAISAKGTAIAQNGSNVNLGGEPIVIGPSDVGAERCATGGTFDIQKACVELALPMSAQIAGRYKFLDGNGAMKGDIELQLDWQNWSAERATNYRVVVDAQAYVNMMPALELKDSIIRHGLQDTYAARLGGSYHIPLDAARGDVIIVRGGLGYDTAAAKKGWLRADLDGAARTTVTLGGGYKAKSWEINLGGGVILEGENTNPGSCNPEGLIGQQGCDGTGTETPIGDRDALDPVNPAVEDPQQAQSPVNQGTYKSSYVMFMLGFTKSF